MYWVEPHCQIIQEKRIDECKDDAFWGWGGGRRLGDEEEINLDKGCEQIGWIYFLVGYRYTI